jgi:hypothetical protein
VLRLGAEVRNVSPASVVAEARRMAAAMVSRHAA